MILSDGDGSAGNFQPEREKWNNYNCHAAGSGLRPGNSSSYKTGKKGVGKTYLLHRMLIVADASRG